MKHISSLAIVIAAALCLTTSVSAAPAGDLGITEVVPTARIERASWRYTTDRPTGPWRRPDFDDSGWKTGPGAFGSAGTPGLPIGTTWNTADIWLRRQVTLPADAKDPSNLQLVVFHDEDAEIYFDGTLAARMNGFIRDYDIFEITPEAAKPLRAGGHVTIAVHCHQTQGGQGIDVGLVSVPPGYVSEAMVARRKARYRNFAMSHPGDAAAGRALFENEQRLACTRCHTTDGKGGRAGPDLSTIGDKFPRPELIDQIINPSATIDVGYSTTVVHTTAGDVVEGIIKESTDDALGLMGADGKLVKVPVREIKSRQVSKVSLMPEGLEAGLSVEEFTDLIAYVSSLRLPEMAAANRQGMPAKISELQTPVALVPIHDESQRFNHPCWFGQIPGEPNKFLACEHETGRVWLLSTAADGKMTKTLWGDFRKEIHPSGATGLLGIAFHPHFRENHKYYLQHELMVGNQMVARVSEKLAAPDLSRDAGQPSRTIVEFACTTDVHSGGGIEFGPDGFLYVAMGDTGPQGDPQGHGQNLTLPLGKMMRIDVDHEEAGRAYAIPADNPFRNQAGVRPEIWAYGFREPWRFSFDPANGDLWVGDVGQDRIEEVDLVHRGENYGWNVFEGFDLFSNRYRSEGATYVPPVYAYDRRLGNSITGGYVNRADKNSPFYGLYVCGDYNSKRIWALKQQDRKLTGIWQLCMAPERVASFGRDEAGRLYVVGYEGTIYRIDFGPARLPAN